MSGSSRSINQVVFANARIAGSPRFTPSHITANSNDGKPISARCEFAVYQNGRKGSENVFKITAWGKLAEAIARGGATGKELTLFCEANSYRGKVWLPNPQGGRRTPVTLNDGSFLFQDKISFTVKDFIFGNDSEPCIANEITAYKSGNQFHGRPEFWNVTSHGDFQIWKNIREARNAEQYTPGAAKFGFAEVFVPEGAQIVANNQAGTGQVQNIGNTQAVAQNFGQYQPNPNVQVQNGQVNVHGQNMGQPVQQSYPQQNAGYAPQMNQPQQTWAPQVGSFMPPQQPQQNPGMVQNTMAAPMNY